MKTIEVVAGVIRKMEQDGSIKFFATQRGYGEQGRVGIPGWKNGTWRNS